MKSNVQGSLWRNYIAALGTSCMKETRYGNRYGKNSIKYLAAITWNKISDAFNKIPKYIVSF